MRGGAVVEDIDVLPVGDRPPDGQVGRGDVLVLDLRRDDVEEPARGLPRVLAPPNDRGHRLSDTVIACVFHIEERAGDIAADGPGRPVERVRHREFGTNRVEGFVDLVGDWENCQQIIGSLRVGEGSARAGGVGVEGPANRLVEAGDAVRLPQARHEVPHDLAALENLERIDPIVDDRLHVGIDNTAVIHPEQVEVVVQPVAEVRREVLRLAVERVGVDRAAVRILGREPDVVRHGIVERGHNGRTATGKAIDADLLRTGRAGGNPEGERIVAAGIDLDAIQHVVA